MQVGYHASHEQFRPSELLQLVKHAEAAGFAAAMCSDHLAPFSEEQGESGFAWSWLGAALGATGFSLGVVNAPGQRYHPVIIGQAVATLTEMFPGRFWAAFGSGQYINEHVTGAGWPPKEVRNRRLEESVGLIRRLLQGGSITTADTIVASNARLYTVPPEPPPLFGAALTEETAAWVAGWADGLITVYQPQGRMEAVISAFRRNAERKPVYLQAQHAFALTDDEARAGAFQQWRHSVLSSRLLSEIRTPGQIDDATAVARPEDVLERVRTSADPFDHLTWLREYEALGVDRVYVHNVTRHQEPFIEAFGRHVLPELDG